MGLDTIAMTEWKDGEYKQAPDEWFEGTPRLVRGIMGGGKENWIRGKTYNNLIQQVTGYSLYENLNNESVRDLSNKLNEYMFIHCASPANRVEQISCEELRELNLWFKVAAEKGCFLHAWY